MGVSRRDQPDFGTTEAEYSAANSRGANPRHDSQSTKTVHVNLEPYHTQTIDYYFYFPIAGQFSHFPGPRREERNADRDDASGRAECR